MQRNASTPATFDAKWKNTVWTGRDRMGSLVKSFGIAITHAKRWEGSKICDKVSKDNECGALFGPLYSFVPGERSSFQLEVTLPVPSQKPLLSPFITKTQRSEETHLVQAPNCYLHSHDTKCFRSSHQYNCQLSILVLLFLIPMFYLCWLHNHFATIWPQMAGPSDPIPIGLPRGSRSSPSPQSKA